MKRTDFKTRLVASAKSHRSQQKVLRKEYVCGKLGTEFWRVLYIIIGDKDISHVKSICWRENLIPKI